MPAIVIYVAYYLFLMSLRNLILTDTIPLYPGLYVVPLVFLLFVAIPLNLPKSYIKRWSRKSRATTAAAAAAANSMTTPNSAADATAAKDATKSEAETAQSTERAASTKSKASAASASSPNKDEKAQRSSDDSEGR